jgi:hypothetical protein
MSYAVAVERRRQALLDELRFALQRMSLEELKSWGKESAALFGKAMARRGERLGGLVGRVAAGAVNEFTQAANAYTSGGLKRHLLGRRDAALACCNSVATATGEVSQVVAMRLKEDPREYAPLLLASILGFYAGSGGNGDGGIPDTDLIAGIGHHRSIFTHSIISGAFVETAVFSLIALSGTLYKYLPADHDPLWDTLASYQRKLGAAFVGGASLGIATHLAIDTAVDGFTCYKDIPLHLPREVHEAFMGLNAAAEAASVTKGGNRC